MQINISLGTIIQLMAATASLIAALILLSYRSKIKEQKLAMNLLSLMFFCLYMWISMEIIQSLEIINMKIGNIFPGYLALIFMSSFVPIHYLHINSLMDQISSKHQILIHFVPTVLLLILGLIFYNSPLFSSWLELSVFLVHIQLFIYWAFELKATLRILSLKKQRKFRVHNGWLKWVIFYLAILPFLFLPFFIFKLTNNSNSIVIWEAMGCLMISLSLFLKPDFLFGLIPIPLRENKVKDSRSVVPINKLNRKRLKWIQKVVEPCLDKQRPHLEKYFTIEQFATEMGLSISDLENYARHYKGLSFEEFINQQRIFYCQSIIKKGAFSMLTLDILAKKSGFKNRSTFIHSFKEFTGYNASDYIHHFLKIPSHK